MLSSTCINFILFLLLTINIISIRAKHTDRIYIINKDRSMPDYRLSEFSIYDSTEKQRQYVIETFDSDIHAVVLYAYPSEQIVGALEGEWEKFIGTANISLLDTHSNQWMDGSITIKFHFYIDKFEISWYGTKITMRRKFVSNKTEVRDEKGNELVASFEPYPNPKSPKPNKYKLIIFSDKVPGVVYFFAVAVMDQSIVTMSR